MPSATPCCPVSQEPYEAEGLNRPRTLPCGHSISHGALEAVLTQTLHVWLRLLPTRIRNLHTGSTAATPTHKPTPSSPITTLSVAASPEPRRTNCSGSTLCSDKAQRTDTAQPQTVLNGPDVVQILNQEDTNRRLCPIDRTPLTQVTADAYPINYAIVEILGSLPAASAEDTLPPPPVADPVLSPFPLHGAAPRAAPNTDLSFAEVLPDGNAELMTDAVWQRVEAAFKLPRTAVDGVPADWAVLGWTPAGHCVYRGLHKSTHGMPSAVALCYGTALSSTQNLAQGLQHAQHESNQRALRAAVAPHIALQLLPDVRPLLPILHGYLLTAEEAEAGAGVEVGPGGRQQVWLAYSLQGHCLAIHLEQQPQHYLPPKLVVAMLRQLASALDAMHRHRLTTGTLYPLSVASVRLDTVHAPSAIRIAPYAREIPEAEARFSSTGAFEALCTPPEAQGGGTIADAAAADVWRAAAVASVALAGDTLREAVRSGAAPTPMMLVDAVRKLRKNPARLPAELADILEACLDRDPARRWTAERMHAALLAETLDGAREAARPAAPPRPPQSAQHVLINMPLQIGEAPAPAQQPAPSGQGQRPTQATRTNCLAKTCYAIATFFAVIIIVSTVSAIIS